MPIRYGGGLGTPYIEKPKKVAPVVEKKEEKAPAPKSEPKVEEKK